ncbi:mevalonate kinase [Candidatus Bathyarchaeota archaeon]|nr:mevalonate kinase [Candidatus Bathyarchaeota archaeon]
MSIAHAPAKVIITGEHFVVHGQPALAAAVNLYSTVSVEAGSPGIVEISSTELGVTARFQAGKEGSFIGDGHRMLEPLMLVIEKILDRAGGRGLGLRVRVESEIPVGVGLGSSASTAVSTATAVAGLLGLKLTRDQICELASVQERSIHKKPSGIDALVTTYGGVVLFKLGQPPFHLEPTDDVRIVIGNTGASRSTGDLVSRMGHRIQMGDMDLMRMSDAVGQITLKAFEAYMRRDFHQLGQLMDENHELLRQAGVSTSQLDNLVEAARDAGAFGAKLTGAGGGGCMIALCRPDEGGRVSKAIEAAGGRSYSVAVDRVGVRIG